MSFLRNLYFFQGQKYTSFGKNILHRQSASLGHSATGHSGYKLQQILATNPFLQAGSIMLDSPSCEELFAFGYSRP